MHRSIWSEMKAAPEWLDVDATRFHREIEPLNRPALLRNVNGHWPAVVKGRESPCALAEYLRAYINDNPLSALVGAPDIEGRFFYREDLQGFNFSQQRMSLGNVLTILLKDVDDTRASALYAGAVPVAQYAPGLLTANRLDLLPPTVARQTSIWIGNRTRVAAHWDLQHNLACVIGGRRRYTLFPIHQIKNLYIGPLDRSPAGVPISLVDFHRPDFERFPRFREALAYAEVAELGPGDALYMPSLWVHHAESLDGFGLMMNFWWQTWSMQPLSPFITMLHSLLSIRDLPLPVREGWRALFDLYVFQTEGDPMAHIPEAARGVFAGANPARTQAIIAQLQHSLEQLKSTLPVGASTSPNATKPPQPR